MASGKALNAANLQALGAARLASLLLEISTGDAAARRRLRLELAGSAGSADVARQVTKRLASIAKARGFIDWRKIKPLVADLEVQRRAILDLVAPADPCEAFELIWRLVGCADSVLSRSGDGSGRLGAIFKETARDLGPLAQAARLDPAGLAQRAFEALRTDRHDAWGELVPILAPHLGAPGLDALRTLLESWHAKPVAIPPEHERKVIGWSSGSGKIYADQIETSHRRSTARFVLRQIADALGDVDGFMAQVEAGARTVPHVAAGIARRLIEAGRPQEALDSLEAAAPRNDDLDLVEWDGEPPGALEWEQARVDALDALGRGEEAQVFRWERFAATLQPTHLRAYLRKLPDFEDFDAEQRALAHAMGYGNAHLALHFLVAWPDLQRASQLVLTRTKELNGNFYAVLGPAADALDTRHPLAATLLRRAMIDFALGQARTSRYKHAARHLCECADLAQRVAEFGDMPDHVAYERALRAAHGRKAAFWEEVAASR